MAACTIHKILIAIDFSECSERALSYGADLARQLGAEVVALHVVPPTSTYRPLDRELWGEAFDEHAFGQRLEQTAQRDLDAFLARQPPQVQSRVQPRLEQGQAYERIVQIARSEGFDLIVVGSHGKSRLERLLMGSVAERVVRHGPCPVLTVH